MTETQAMSGAAGTPANPVEDESTASGASATGRAAVGRATVPAENTTSASPSGASTSSETEAPPVVKAESSTSTFSRPPGIAPPEPDEVSSTSRTGSLAGSTAADSGVGGKSALKSVATAGQLGAARVTEAVRAARSNVTSAASRGPRRARLALKRIDPWSVMKFSFAVSLVLFLVIIVATAVLYLALDAMHVFDSINGSLGELIKSGGGASADGGTSPDGGFQITAGGVIGTSALVGAVNVVLFTALATLSAFIYNVCADLVGGIEVTLAERD